MTEIYLNILLGKEINFASETKLKYSAYYKYGAFIIIVAKLALQLSLHSSS